MMIRTAQILLTIVTLQTGVVPLLVDLNASHVFHDGWLPHARFHTAWAITVGAGLALYVLALIWIPTENRSTRLRYASAPGCIFLGAFFVAVFFIDEFGGGLTDVEDPVRFFGFDGNVFGFTVAAIVQTVGTFAAWKSVDA
jgi:uncharacterized protein DUF6640